MQRKPISLNWDEIPSEFHSFLQDAGVFDSSCSKAARVWFLDKDSGFYLKTAPKGSLEKEASLTSFFHTKGLGAEVLTYESRDADWMLTRRVPGEDCTWQPYKDNPVRLCDTTAELLRMLHETPFTGCPVPHRTSDYLAAAKRNYQQKVYDVSLFPDTWGYATPEEAWKVVEETGRYLKTDTLLHGDYCLPNIMLDNWHFTGFIDLDKATGQVARFESMYAEYIKNPTVTKQRMFYETMEEVLPDLKLIIDSSDGDGVQKILPLEPFSSTEINSTSTTGSTETAE